MIIKQYVVGLVTKPHQVTSRETILSKMLIIPPAFMPTGI